MRNCLIAVALIGAIGACGCQSGGVSGPREIKVTVTDHGFEPSEIKVNKGDDVTLVVTRETEQTCATEIVIADMGINQELPLNETVRVALGVVDQDEITFACGMDMIKGAVVAR